MKTEKNISENKNRKKIVSDKMVLLFLSLFFSVLIMFILLIPQYEQTRINEMETDLTQKALDSKRDIFMKLTSFNRTYKDISETEINKMYDLLPDNDNSEEHLANIAKLARANGILITDISFSEDEKQKSLKSNDENVLKTTTINFFAESKFLNFMLFLDNLEKSIPITSIESISIAKKGNEGDGESAEVDENVEIEVKLLFYHL